MSILRYFTSCMSRSKGSVNADEFISNYGNVELDIFYVDDIPDSVKDLLVYIAREGVAVTDLFRRPGNIQHINKVIHQMKLQEPIDWSKYNFYTLANIAKRFLRQIDKGVLGETIELELVNALDLPDDQSRIEEMSRILKSLSQEVLELLALLFGTWFRMIYHSEVNAMSVEAVAKSVAGSIFPSCTNDPVQVNRASKVMEYLITGFASSELFGIELIEYFTNETKTSISRIEKFKYEFIYPKNVSRKKSTRLFVRMLIDESIKHGFDLLKNEVTEDQFNATDNCAIITGNIIEESSNVPFSNSSDGDNKTRKRRLSKTYPPSSNNQPVHNSGQVQQTSEKRTCVVASSTDIGLTTTTSTLEFDMTQECIHHNKSLVTTNGDQHLSVSHSTNSSSPLNDNRKSPRLDVSENIKLEEVIKSELQKMDNLKKGDDNSKGHNGPSTGGRFSKVKRQQLERLQKRSDWFLSPPSGCKSEALMQLSPTSPTIRDPPLSIASDNCTMSGNFDMYDLLSSTIEESNSNIARDSQNNEIGKISMPNNISSSDPTLFHSSNGANLTNGMSESQSKDVTIHNDTNLLEDEIDVRYFVVHKYYGPLPSRPDASEE